MGDQRSIAVHRLDDDGNTGRRNLRRLQRLEHGGRQAVGEGRQAESAEKGAEK